MFLVWAQAGFAQENSSRIITSSGMPSRISMNVTVPRQQQRAASADSTRNPLYEQGGSSGQNPLFEGISQPAQSGDGQMKNRKKDIKAPSEKPPSGLKDVVKTQV